MSVFFCIFVDLLCNHKYKAMDTITICLGSSCFARGNNVFLNTIKDFLSENQLEDKVLFKGELCTQNCSDGPNIRICDCLHSNLDEQKIMSILTQHFKK